MVIYGNLEKNKHHMHKIQLYGSQKALTTTIQIF